MRSWNKIFVAVSGLGIIYAGTGLTSFFKGAGLCASDGCSAIASAARFGETPVIILGVLFFLGLTGLSWLSLNKKNVIVDPLVGVVLTAGCAVEGFLVGYQAFMAGSLCRYCIGIAGFVAVLAVVYVLANRAKWWTAPGFAAVFLGVLMMTAMVKVPETWPGTWIGMSSVGTEKIGTEKIGTISGNQYYLIFGKDCSNCKDVINFCRQNSNENLVMTLCPVEKCRPFLKSLGVQEVPTLYVDKGSKKEIIIGKRDILAYLYTSEVLGINRSGFSPLATSALGARTCNENTTCQ